MLADETTGSGLFTMNGALQVANGLEVKTAGAKIDAGDLTVTGGNTHLGGNVDFTSATPQQAPPAHPCLSGMPLVAGTIALSAATFMVVLDTSIANVSIPAISGDVGVSTSQGTWVITSFAVSNAIAVPLTGWLTQRFGSVRLFLASTLAFGLTRSVIAASRWIVGATTRSRKRRRGVAAPASRLIP